MQFRVPKMTRWRMGIALALFLSALVGAAWAVRVPPGETPYLKIAGASFIFNYRLADSYYGFTALVTKPVRAASVIEAAFEDPAGGPDHVVRQTIRLPARQYGIRSPPLKGIEKGRPYTVRVKLIQQGDSAVLFEKAFAVTSNMSDAVMPTEPMTIGPGYAKNPRAAPETAR